MAEAGMDVTVIGFPAEGIATGGYGYRSVYAEARPWQQRMARWGRARLGNWWLFIAELAWVTWRAFRTARKERFDILYFCDTEIWMTLIASLVASSRSMNRRTVATIGFSITSPPFFQVRPFVTLFRQRLNCRLLHWLQYCVRLLFVDQFTPQIAGLKRYGVIGEGLEGQKVLDPREARRRIGLSPDDRMLLMFGLAAPSKGSAWVFRVLPRVKPQFHLCVVGMTGGQYLQSWGDSSGLDSTAWRQRVHVVSRYVSEDEKELYFAACSGVVLPYAKGYTMPSGVLAHAIECSRPVLVSDQHEIGRMVRTHNIGMAFRPGDDESLAECLNRFADVPDSWFEAMAENCRRAVRELSWRKVGQEYKKFFESCMVGRNGVETRRRDN
jgi:glycosyltransferase involved in cell wall biosynthesis